MRILAWGGVTAPTSSWSRDIKTLRAKSGERLGLHTQFGVRPIVVLVSGESQTRNPPPTPFEWLLTTNSEVCVWGKAPYLIASKSQTEAANAWGSRLEPSCSRWLRLAHTKGLGILLPVLLESAEGVRDVSCQAHVTGFAAMDAYSPSP